jgi:hypothetical protein
MRGVGIRAAGRTEAKSQNPPPRMRNIGAKVIAEQLNTA